MRMPMPCASSPEKSSSPKRSENVPEFKRGLHTVKILVEGEAIGFATISTPPVVEPIVAHSDLMRVSYPITVGNNGYPTPEKGDAWRHLLENVPERVIDGVTHIPNFEVVRDPFGKIRRTKSGVEMRRNPYRANHLPNSWGWTVDSWVPGTAKAKRVREVEVVPVRLTRHQKLSMFNPFDD